MYTSACPLSLEAWHGHLRYSHGLERWFVFTGRTRSGISAWGIYKNDGIQDLEYVEDIDLVEGTDPGSGKSLSPPTRELAVGHRP